MPERKIQVSITGSNLAGPAFDRLNRDLGQAQQRAASTTSSLNMFERAASRLGGALGGIASQAAGFAAGMAAFYAMQRAFEAVSDAAIGFNSRLQQSQIGWEVLLKGAERGKAMLFDLQQTALKLGIDFGQMEEGSRVLLNMGVQAKEVKSLYLDIKAVAAGVGRNDAAERITMAIGQMLAKGMVSAEEMTQQMGELIPAWQILADYIGKSVQETQKLAQEGKILPQTFIDAFRAFSQANYGDMISRQATTWEGATARMGSAFQIFVSTALKPGFDRLTSLFNKIADFAASDEFMAWSQRAAAAVDVALDAVGDLAQGFADGLGAVLNIVLDVGRAIWEALTWINPWAEHSPSLVSQVETGTEAIGQAYDDMAPRVATALDRTATATRDFAGSADALKQYAADAKRVFDDLNDQLSEAEGRLRDWLNTPIAGTQKYVEAERAIQRDIDALQHKINSLKLSNAPKATIEALERAMDRLQLRADNVRLEERLELGPLRDQLEDMTKPAEKPFAEILRGVQDAQREIATLEPKVQAAETDWKRLQSAYEDVAAAQRGVAGATSGLGDAINTTKNKLAGIDDYLANAKQKLKDWEDGFNKAKETAQRNLKPFTDAVEGVAQKLRELRDISIDPEMWFRRLKEYDASAAVASFTAWADTIWEGSNGKPGLRQRLQDQMDKLGPWAEEYGPVIAEKVGVWAGALTGEAAKIMAGFITGVAAWLTGDGGESLKKLGGDAAGAFGKGFAEGFGQALARIPFGPYELKTADFLANLGDYMTGKINLFDLLGKSFERVMPVVGPAVAGVPGPEQPWVNPNGIGWWNPDWGPIPQFGHHGPMEPEPPKTPEPAPVQVPIWQRGHTPPPEPGPAGVTTPATVQEEVDLLTHHATNMSGPELTVEDEMKAIDEAHRQMRESAETNLGAAADAATDYGDQTRRASDEAGDDWGDLSRDVGQFNRQFGRDMDDSGMAAGGFARDVADSAGDAQDVWSVLRRAIEQNVDAIVDSIDKARDRLTAPWTPVVPTPGTPYLGGGGGGGTARTRDQGGPVLPGVPYIIGANTGRPEVFVPTLPGMVLPPTTTQPAAPSVALHIASLVGSVNVYNEADEDRLLAKLEQLMEDEVEEAFGMGTRRPMGAARR